MIKKVHYTEVPPDPVGEERASGLTIRSVITEEDGAENFSMRVFEVESGGSSSFHAHPWEHEVLIVDGEGVAMKGDEKVGISEGDVLFIPPGQKHQLRNTSEEKMAFICLIPNLNEV